MASPKFFYLVRIPKLEIGIGLFDTLVRITFVSDLSQNSYEYVFVYSW